MGRDIEKLLKTISSFKEDCTDENQTASISNLPGHRNPVRIFDVDSIRIGGGYA
jgi:hypothetical protein